jgi:hypothetical protein
MGKRPGESADPAGKGEEAISEWLVGSESDNLWQGDSSMWVGDGRLINFIKMGLENSFSISIPLKF